MGGSERKERGEWDKSTEKEQEVGMSGMGRKLNRLRMIDTRRKSER